MRLEKLKKQIINKFEKSIIKIIEKHCLSWGVKLDTTLPPEFVITYHAMQRLRTRTNIAEDKFKKVCMKAWQSTEKIDIGFINSKNYQRDQKNISYRKFIGKIFVFKEQFNYDTKEMQKILITIY